MKKKIIGSIIVLFICIFMTGFSSEVYAEETTIHQEETTSVQITEEATTDEFFTDETTSVTETTTFQNVMPETNVDIATKSETDGKWIKLKKGYKYRYGNGTYAKHGIITVNLEKYYIDKNGYRTKGIVTYKGKRYYFKKTNGRMYTGTKIISFQKNKYYVVKGKVVTGLKKIKKSYYYFSKKSGKMVKNKLIKVKENYYNFGKSGKGVKKTAAQAYAIKLIKKLCSFRDSKQEMLRKGFWYMAYHYHYAIKPGFVAPSGSGWVEDFAYNIYTTHSGRCYSFAAAFGVYAREVGYTARVINASTSGIRGGYVPHAWVEVVQNGHTYVYDPELAYQTGNISSYYKRTYASTGARYRK